MDGPGKISNKEIVPQIIDEAPGNIEEPSKSDKFSAGNSLVEASKAQKWKAYLCRAVIGMGGLRKESYKKYDDQIKSINSYLKQSKASQVPDKAQTPNTKINERKVSSTSIPNTLVSLKAMGQRLLSKISTLTPEKPQTTAPLPNQTTQILNQINADINNLSNISQAVFDSLSTKSMDYYEANKLANEQVWGGSRFKMNSPIAQTAIRIGKKFFSGNLVGKDFIATQAPVIPGESEESMQSLKKFYQVMLDQNVHTVINLTSFEDTRNSKDLMYRYWPNSNEPLTLGSVSVTKKDVEKSPEFETTTLKIKQKASLKHPRPKTREVKILHYYQWLDQGVPEGKDLKKLTEALDKRKLEGKTMVHCRAGVGRTGTMIVLRQLQEGIRAGKISQENLLKAATELVWQGRHERSSLFVQSPGQFEFILREALKEFDQPNNNTIINQATDATIVTGPPPKKPPRAKSMEKANSELVENGSQTHPVPKPRRRDAIRRKQPNSTVPIPQKRTSVKQGVDLAPPPAVNNAIILKKVKGNDQYPIKAFMKDIDSIQSNAQLEHLATELKTLREERGNSVSTDYLQQLQAGVAFRLSRKK